MGFYDAWVDGDRIGRVNGRGRVYATPLGAELSSACIYV